MADRAFQIRDEGEYPATHVELSNVVRFVPHGSTRDRSAAISVDRDLQFPCVHRTRRRGTALATFFAASVAIHAAIFVALNREAPPLASVGIPSISVDIVLGGKTTAGLASKPAKSESPIASEEVRPIQPETVAPELKTAASAAPVAPPAIAALSDAQPLPPEPPKQVTTTTAQPISRQKHQAAKPSERVARAHRTAPTRPRPSSRAVASNGIGQGRSASESNYRGIVAAQLARYKSFPGDARLNGEHGSAAVSFTIEASGRVGSVRLVRGSGYASLDREAQAMVRRASPFPPPPGQRSVRFTVPVDFNLRR